MKLMAGMREAIQNDTFLDFYRTHRENLGQGDGGEPPKRKPAHKKSRPAPLQIGRFEIVQNIATAEPGVFGSAIRDNVSGEFTHALNAPDEEAHRRYVEESKILTLLKIQNPEYQSLLGGEPDKPVVVWDVGMGAAFNAMAIVTAYEAAAAGGEKLRPLHISSFSEDPAALELALGHPWLFPHTRHAGPHTVWRERLWESKQHPVRWELFHGDFLESKTRAPEPDLILHANGSSAD